MGINILNTYNTYILVHSQLIFWCLRGPMGPSKSRNPLILCGKIFAIWKYFSKIHCGLSFHRKIKLRGSKSLKNLIFFKKKYKKNIRGTKNPLKWPDNSYLSKIKGVSPTRFLRFFGHRIWSNWARELRF